MRFADQAKMKAVTFSYDDGVTQDIRLVELLNKYAKELAAELRKYDETGKIPDLSRGDNVLQDNEAYKNYMTSLENICSLLGNLF